MILSLLVAVVWEQQWSEAFYPELIAKLERRAPLTDEDIEFGMYDANVFEMMLFYEPSVAHHHPGPGRYPMSIKIWVTTFNGQNMPNKCSQNWPTFMRKCRAFVRAGGDLNEPQPFNDTVFGWMKGDRLQQVLEDEVKINPGAERFLKEFRGLARRS